MTEPVRAGIDVGNATTEVVLAHGDGVLGAGRAPTRRSKGSPESLAGAAALVRRLERQYGVRVVEAVAAPLRPVTTVTASLPEPVLDTGRLRVVAAGAGTVGGAGVGVGRPVPLAEVPIAPGEPVVVVAPAGAGFRAVVDAVTPLQSAGLLAAVVLADDEAVLVANRLGGAVPVVDQADVGAALACELLLVEVTTEGRTLRVATDPLRLVALLSLTGGESEHAARAAATLADAGNAVVGVTGAPRFEAAVPRAPAWVELGDGSRHDLVAGQPVPGQETVGAVRAVAVPPRVPAAAVDDVFAVDLGAVARSVRARRPAALARPLGLAALSAVAAVDPGPALGGLLGVPVGVVASEAEAARAGALTTPGAPDTATVVDLGGGTVDLVTPDGAVVAAGAGDLLTASVAALTRTTPAAAEWVKRGPAHRVEAPQVLLDEDGTRRFLDRPSGGDAVGRLVVPGPAGLLPFSDRMAPGEWRALRLALKVACLGGNLARAARTAGGLGPVVVLVGGPAEDDEVLTAVTGALPPGTVVARGEVAGRLGARYAVAWGLLQLTTGVR